MWSEITTEEFEAVPGKEAPKPNRWDELLDAIDQGKVIRLPANDQNSLRGMRIGIGRRAKFRQIPIETRATADALFIRRSADPDTTSGNDGTGALLEHTIGEPEQPGAVDRLTPDELAAAEPAAGKRPSNPRSPTTSFTAPRMFCAEGAM